MKRFSIFLFCVCTAGFGAPQEPCQNSMPEQYESCGNDRLLQLEMQLGVIQGLLKISGHQNPYDYETEELLHDAYYGYIEDSLHHRFYTLLEEACKLDSAMQYPFDNLKHFMDVTMSADKRLRIFSRDTYKGGTTLYLSSYAQYMPEDTVRFGYMPDLYSDDEEYIFGESEGGLFCDTIHTVENEKGIVYLVEGSNRLTSIRSLVIIRAVCISNGKVKNEPVFDTGKGPGNYLSVAYETDVPEDADRRMFRDNDPWPHVSYDAEENIIIQPVVEKVEGAWAEHLTGEVIIYRWKDNMFRPGKPENNIIHQIWK